MNWPPVQDVHRLPPCVSRDRHESPPAPGPTLQRISCHNGRMVGTLEFPLFVFLKTIFLLLSFLLHDSCITLKSYSSISPISRLFSCTGFRNRSASFSCDETKQQPLQAAHYSPRRKQKGNTGSDCEPS